MEIDRVDYEELVELAEKISIKPNNEYSFSDVEVVYHLQLELEGADIVLAWGGAPPESWSGVKELVEAIELIIKIYNKKMEKGWGRIPEIKNI